MSKTYLLYTAGDYIETPVTGGTKRFYELLESLLETGNKVYLIAPKNINIPSKNKCRVLSIRTYHSRFVPDSLLNLLMNMKTFRKAKKLSVDRTILFSVPYGIQGVLAGFRRIVLLLREDLLEYNSYYSEKKDKLFNLRLFFYKFVERIVVKRVATIILQSEYDKYNLLSRHKNISDSIEKKILILSNNVNASWMTSSRHLIRQKPVEPKDEFHLVFSGSMDTRRKGGEVILEAVKQLLQEGFSVKLSLLGDGKYRRIYEQQYNVFDNIDFLGYQQNPLEFISHADLLVVPSFADSCPNVILEGLFLQIPVIGSNKGGIPEILKYPELLFEPDVLSLKSKIEKIITGKQLENIRQKCIERKKHFIFDWSTLLIQLINS